MAKNVTIAGASYTAVPSIDLPITGGGTASFIDPEDAEAALGSDGTEDLDVAIEALTTYANTVTGASDTDLSSAVATLAAGYGGGGASWDNFAANSIPSGSITLTCTSVGSYGMGLQGGSSWTCSSTTLTSISMYGFRNARLLTAVYFPNLTTLGGSSFYYCSALTTADIGSANIKASEFASSALSVLIMRKTTALQTLANVNAFNGTKFKSGGTGGTIYIPQTLYNQLGTGSSLDYQSATKWSTVYGYGTITWAVLEGSIYE